METVATVRVPRAIASFTVAARSSVKRSVSAWRAVSAPAVIDGRPRTGAPAADGTTAGTGGAAAAAAPVGAGPVAAGGAGAGAGAGAGGSGTAATAFAALRR